MKEEIQVRISEEELIAKIKEIAQQINEDYVGKKVHLVCILSGSVFFTCELAKYITVPVTMDFMRVSSYGDGQHRNDFHRSGSEHEYRRPSCTGGRRYCGFRTHIGSFE